MHELSIANSVVEMCAERAQGARVLRVTLEIGALCAVLPDAIRFCFDVCAKDTLVEGAALDIVELPGLARCTSCATEMEMDQPYGRCKCGSVSFEWLSGQQLRVRQMEVA